MQMNEATLSIWLTASFSTEKQSSSGKNKISSQVLVKTQIPVFAQIFRFISPF